MRVQRETGGLRGRPRQRHRHAEQRIRAEAPLVGRPVERDHLLVDRALNRALAFQRRRDLAVDVGDRLS